MSRDFEDYRGYSIVYNKTGARLLSGDGSLAHPKTFDGLDEAKEWIDTHLGELEEDRRAPHVGTVEGYTEALTLQEPSKKQWLMLVNHAAAEGHRLNADQLAEAAGWKRGSSANLHYGKLGRALAEQLNLTVDGDNGHAFTHTIGEYDEETSDWIMHPELVQALEQINADAA